MGTPSHENQAQLDARVEDKWRDAINRLKHYTYIHYYWLPMKVRGADLDDLVSEAIVDTLRGRRIRPPDVNLVTFLTHVVDSKVSHLLDKEKKVVPLEDVSPARLVTPVDSPYAIRPEEKERQEVSQRICERLRKLVDGDEDLRRIVDVRLAKPELKARQIARELGMTPDELRNALKRLSRRAKELWEEWKNVYGR